LFFSISSRDCRRWWWIRNK